MSVMQAVRLEPPDAPLQPGARLLMAGLLTVTMFPVFGLGLHDRTPFTPGTTLAPDQWFRLGWLCLLGGMLTVAGWRLQAWKWQYGMADALLFSLPVAAALSVLFTLPQDVMAWYRVAGLLLVTLSVVVLTGYARHVEQEGFEALLWAILGVALAMLGVLLLGALLEPNRVVRMDGPRIRLGGDLYNPIPLSVQMVLAQVAVAILILRKRLPRGGGVLLFAGLHVATFFTYSRSGWILALLADVGLLWLVLNPTGRRWIGFGIVGFMAGCGVLLLHTDSRAWLISLFVTGPGFGDEQGLLTLSGRIPLYREALLGLREHVWWGVGYGEGVRYYLADRLWGPLHTHNILIQLILGLGAVLSLPFLVLLFRAVWGGVRVYAQALQVSQITARTGVALCFLLVFLDMQVNGGLGYGIDHYSVQALLLIRLLGEIKMR